MTSQKQLVRKLQKAFPNIKGIAAAEDLWGSPGSVHLGDSAEGGTINGLPACDYYSEDYSERTYIMGVHRLLHGFLLKHGWYAECYDPGTYFAYEA